MKRVVYIASLSHSGSTLLDILLSKQEGVIGLGEISNILNQKSRTIEGTENICSCGKVFDECPTWSVLLKSIGQKKKYIDKYGELINIIRSDLPTIDTVIDSSKKYINLSMVDQVLKPLGVDLKVLFLVRDFRAWSYSNKKRYQSLNINKFYYCYPYFFWLWRRENLKIYNFLKDNNIDFKFISYESLCANPTKIIKEAISYFGNENDNYSLLNDPNSHIAYGNRMKFSKDLVVKYDNKWCSDYFVNFWSIFSPHLFNWISKR